MQKFLLLATVTLATLCGCQSPSTPPSATTHRSADCDRSGGLNREEMQQFVIYQRGSQRQVSDAEFTSADTNGDKSLSLAELVPLLTGTGNGWSFGMDCQ